MPRSLGADTSETVSANRLAMLTHTHTELVSVILWPWITAEILDLHS